MQGHALVCVEGTAPTSDVDGEGVEVAKLHARLPVTAPRREDGLALCAPKQMYSCAHMCGARDESSRMMKGLYLGSSCQPFPWMRHGPCHMGHIQGDVPPRETTRLAYTEAEIAEILYIDWTPMWKRFVAKLIRRSRMDRWPLRRILALYPPPVQQSEGSSECSSERSFDHMNPVDLAQLSRSSGAGLRNLNLACSVTYSM